MPVDLSKLNAALVIVCGIIVFTLTILIFFVILLRKRQNFFLQEKQLIQVQHESMLLRSKVEIQEQLSTALSAEIHDNIGQALSLVRLNLNSLNKGSDADKILHTDEILGNAIEDLRTLSHNLHTQHIVDKGLPVAVADLLKNLERTSFFKTSYLPKEDFSDLSDEQTLVFFRIIQEAVANIVKHAKASHILVEMVREGVSNIIRVADDGKGFAASHLTEGIGLKNMHARAKMIGAALAVNSEQGKGTEVIISF